MTPLLLGLPVPVLLQGFDQIIKGKYLHGHEAAHKATMKKYNISEEAAAGGKAGQVGRSIRLSAHRVCALARTQRD